MACGEKAIKTRGFKDCGKTAIKTRGLNGLWEKGHWNPGF